MQPYLTLLHDTYQQATPRVICCVRSQDSEVLSSHFAGLLIEFDYHLAVVISFLAPLLRSRYMSTYMRTPPFAIFLTASLLACFALTSPARAQNETTGAFAGTVTDPTGAPISGARVLVTLSGQRIPERQSHRPERAVLSSLAWSLPLNTISVSQTGYKTQELRQTVYATQTNSVIPVPVTLLQDSPPPTPLPRRRFCLCHSRHQLLQSRLNHRTKIFASISIRRTGDAAAHSRRRRSGYCRSAQRL